MSGLDDLNPDDAEFVRDIMDVHGFSSLKTTQELAFDDGILSPGNHLLVAETGNGKTLCAEAVTRKRLEQGDRVAYLVPSRQLVRDKRETLREWGSDEYYIASGPRSYQTADVVVATFDSFYRAILRDVGSARNLDLLVLDDFHEIYGGFRGPDIEKAIAAAQYEGIEMFAMSATLGNPEDLADWMDADCTVSPEGRQIEIQEEVVDVGRQEKKDALVDLIRSKQDRAPFLVFNYAKPWTESRAEAIAKERLFDDAPNQNFRTEMRAKVDGEVTDTLEGLARMMEAGVAFHHADLPREIQEWIIDLYDEGELQCLCATTTIAYGFDAPVQSVVVADHKRGPRQVGIWEYVQWIGRAARPGYGYEKGYAYTLTDTPEETVERFFEPYRELEDVTTHIENDQRFRWLVLELIATGWDTSHEIEAFIKEMLYWQQMNRLGSWGREHDSRDERLNQRLRATANWLEANGFVREKGTERRFHPTKLGEGAVEFSFESFASATLTEIRAFYDWLEETPQKDLTELSLAEQCARLFDETLSEGSASSELEGALQEHDLPIDKYAITAGVIRWYWMQNLDTREIEERADIDAAYLSSTAGSLADIIDATQYLIDATPNTRRPDWFDTLVFRVERGVRSEEVPFVENVRGMGRYRVRQVRKYLESPDIPGVPDLPDGSLWDRLVALYEAIDDASQFEDVLRGNITGVGPATARNLRSFIERSDVDKQDTQSGHGVDSPIVQDESDDDESDFTRPTSLDEFWDS